MVRNSGKPTHPAFFSFLFLIWTQESRRGPIIRENYYKFAWPQREKPIGYSSLPTKGRHQSPKDDLRLTARSNYPYSSNYNQQTLSQIVGFRHASFTSSSNLHLLQTNPLSVQMSQWPNQLADPIEVPNQWVKPSFLSRWPHRKIEKSKLGGY